MKFVQDDISISSKHVLRGIHGDSETWKLISCLYGKFYLVVVNWDKNSPSISSGNHLPYQKKLYSSPGASKFWYWPSGLSEQAIFCYKQSTYYNRANQFTLVWNDRKLDIWWPIKKSNFITKRFGDFKELKKKNLTKKAQKSEKVLFLKVNAGNF